MRNVGSAIQGLRGVTLLGGGRSPQFIAGWGQGHEYTPRGPTNFQGSTAPFPRAASLLDGGNFHQQSKPTYGELPVTGFLGARSAGVTGDGIFDDTTALQALLNQAAGTGKVVFFDAGIYKISRILHVPPGSRLVGETFPVIMSSGS